MSSVHALSVQAVVAPAASVFQHFFVNAEQVALVPVYEVQGAEEAKHPFPLVKHPAKKVLHKESVLWVFGASVQARFLHCVPVQKHGVVVVVPPDT